MVAYKTNEKNFGGMYIYENTANVIPIVLQNIYHPIRYLVTGLVNNFTFDAGSSGTAASVATYDSGNKIQVTCNDHGLLDGEPVIFIGSTNYDGRYVVESRTANTFVVAKAWVATRTFDWYQPSLLKMSGVTTIADGTYWCSWTTSIYPEINNELFKFEVVKVRGGVFTDQDNMAAESKMKLVTDVQCQGAAGTLSLKAGDMVYIQCANLTGTGNITIKHGNLTLVKYN